MKTNKTSHKKSSRGLAKRVATILLAGAMIVPVALSASACRVTITDNGDGTFSINPANPNDKDNNTSSQGSTNTPQDNQTTPKEPDYSKYSPLLQEVLNDPEYDELYRMYKSNELYEASSHFDAGANLLEAIPYDFLTSKDEDIEGIKTGAIRVNSEPYIIQNEEENYIYDRVELTYWVNDGENYIHQYLLQYKITEQELKDLTMLYNGRYFQGPVMFQRLASKQTPKVIAEFAITEKAYKEVLSVCNSTSKYATLSKLLNHDVISSFTLTSLDYGIIWDENSFDITFKLINEGNSRNSVSNRTLYTVSSSLIPSTSRATYNNGLLDLESFSGVNSTILNSTPITYFQLFGNFKNFKDRL